MIALVLWAVYSTSRMIRILGTVFAGLMGLAFGSFLNVCLSRWPAGESVVAPRSHCRGCGHALAWWENVPLISWLGLRGRCRGCGGWIGWRYLVVEGAIGGLWAVPAWQLFREFPDPELPLLYVCDDLLLAFAWMLFYWLVVALAVLDAEHLWLPDRITLPGAAIGVLFTPIHELFVALSPMRDLTSTLIDKVGWALLSNLLNMLMACGLVLLIRWVYRLIRRREGMGLGDAKLMAMLGAWLGLRGALLAFGLGVVIAALFALGLLGVASVRKSAWGFRKLPLGTFLCVGGIVSSLWGERIIAAYLGWAGF